MKIDRQIDTTDILNMLHAQINGFFSFRFYYLRILEFEILVQRSHGTDYRSQRYNEPIK